MIKFCYLEIFKKMCELVYKVKASFRPPYITVLPPRQDCSTCLPPVHENAVLPLAQTFDFLPLIGGDSAKKRDSGGTK